MINNMSDEEKLLQAARNHQRDALIAIYDTYQAQIYAYAYRTLLDADMAEECTAVTFHRFLEALQKGKGPTAHLRAYLYRIAHNWMMDTFRKKERVQLASEDIAENKSDGKASPNELFVQQQTSVELQKQLATLTPDQREVVVLRFVDENSLEDTALILHKPVGAVKSLQNRALTHLRKYYLSKDQDEL
jgi:RNA polymerase sigma-70 factor (ECF subfamily)